MTLTETERSGNQVEIRTEGRGVEHPLAGDGSSAKWYVECNLEATAAFDVGSGLLERHEGTVEWFRSMSPNALLGPRKMSYQARRVDEFTAGN